MGYEVEALAVSDSRTVEGMADARGTWRSLSARIPGLAASAVIGLMEARGDLLVVLDPERGYSPDDICRALEPLANGEADVVVARRGGGGGVRGRLRDLAGAMIRPWLGASGLRPGLVAMT
ncbi:MAG: glycosyltransferase, partial [Planctomycetaceae bacterium]|nr:glycosyltransferase [Planctomycetaceae bacterium]